VVLGWESAPACAGGSPRITSPVRSVVANSLQCSRLCAGPWVVGGEGLVTLVTGPRSGVLFV
jgi:hypothetical protein